MILERLSESTRKELEALSARERQALAKEIAQTAQPEMDPVVAAFFDTIEERPLINPATDPVALVREGRRG